MFAARALLRAARAPRAQHLCVSLRGMRVSAVSAAGKVGGKAPAPAPVTAGADAGLSLSGVLAKEIAYEAEEAGSEAQLAGLASAIKAATGFSLQGAFPRWPSPPLF